MVRNDGTPDDKNTERIAMINKGYNYPSSTYIVAFIVLHQQGYRTVQYPYWFYMLKWLSNPEYYRIDKYLNNGNVNFVKSSEYGRYVCKIAGRLYPCDSLEINYFETKYLYILEEEINIDFSDSNNNCEYVQ
ncbi:hypothetical protein C1646_766313 [Rhizophagus diaphanus]|nr:hypothetical protein C1646_766313 [Rhizophagus diaphanus] [Rhizophagus sp. MUCL 43196]